MQAVVYEATSQDFSTLKIQQIPKPVATKGQVVVKVNVAAINPVDALVHRGFLKVWHLPLPFTPGYDFAGVVDSVGEDVAGFGVGERVFAVNWGQGGHGTEGTSIGGAFAEYILIPASKLSKIPAALSDELAAAVALVGTTAYQVLFDVGRVAAGTRLLILGGASSVGSIAIQLAKNVGAHVITTCSSRTLDVVSKLQPDQIINYEQEKWETVLAANPVDVLFDAVGDAEAWKRSSGIVKDGGVFVTISSPDAGYNPAGHPPLRFASFFCLSNSAAVQDALAQHLVEGKLKLSIQQEYPFTEAGILSIFQNSESKRTLGKHLVRIAQPAAAAAAGAAASP